MKLKRIISCLLFCIIGINFTHANKLETQASPFIQTLATNDSDHTKEKSFSLTQLYEKKISKDYSPEEQLAYESAVKDCFERIQDSPFLKNDPVYEELKNNRESFSITDKETLVLRHENLMDGLHKAFEKLAHLQKQNNYSSKVTSENSQNENYSLLVIAKQIITTVFDFFKRLFPQFFKAKYDLQSKIKIAETSPAMQEVAKFLNIENDEFDIQINFIQPSK